MKPMTLAEFRKIGWIMSPAESSRIALALRERDELAAELEAERKRSDDFRQQVLKAHPCNRWMTEEKP